MRTALSFGVFGLWAIVGCGGYEPGVSPPAAAGDKQAEDSGVPASASATAAAVSMIWPRPQSDATEGSDAEFSLRVRISLDNGKVSGTTPVALVQASPPKLSSAESAVAEQAVALRLDSCRSEKEAISFLEKMVPDRALQRFAEVFAGASTETREAIVWSAARRSEPSAAALIVRGMMDANKDVRNASMYALAAAGKTLPVDALLAACKTASPEEICRALDRIHDKEAASALPAIKALAAHQAPAVRAKALELAGHAEDVSLAGGLRRSLSHSSPLVRGAALRGLSALKQLTEEDLLAAAPGNDDEASAAVLELIKPTDNATLRAVVDDAFAAPSGSQRKLSAITAMGRLGDPADIPRLIDCLKDDKLKDVRAAAAKALGNHTQFTDHALLIAVAAGKSEKDYEVRRAAAAALAASKKGLQAALASLKPGRSTEWQNVVSAVAAQAPPDAEALAAVIKLQDAKTGSGWKEIAGACDKLAPAERRPLQSLILERADGFGQAKVIKSLLADGSSDARQVLRAACAYPSVLPRREVETKIQSSLSGTRMTVWFEPVYGSAWEVLCEAFRSLKDPELAAAEAALLKTALASTEHPDTEVRAGAVRVIARFGLKDNVQAVWKAMQDKESEVRAAFLEALRDVPPSQALPALQSLAADNEYGVRRRVAATAAALGGDEILPVLRSFLSGKSSDGERAAAIAGIAKYPAHAAMFLDAAATLTEHDSQAEVARVLAALPPNEAVSALGALAVGAKEDDLAVKAIQKLIELAASGKMDRPQAGKALQTIVQGAAEPRKLVAACSLAAIGDPNGLSLLLALPEAKRSSEGCIVTAELSKMDENGLLIVPERVDLVALLSFRSGYESTGVQNKTYLFNLPLRIPRARDRFGGGDRWPLNSRHDLSDLDPVLLAVATYRDPRADARISEALKSTNANTRRSALWGLTLRDDRAGVEALLNDPDATLRKECIEALRLLGHRASLEALGPKVKGSVPAARAAVELALDGQKEQTSPASPKSLKEL